MRYNRKKGGGSVIETTTRAIRKEKEHWFLDTVRTEDLQRMIGKFESMVLYINDSVDHRILLERKYPAAFPVSIQKVLKVFVYIHASEEYTLLRHEKKDLDIYFLNQVRSEKSIVSWLKDKEEMDQVKVTLFSNDLQMYAYAQREKVKQASYASVL